MTLETPTQTKPISRNVVRLKIGKTSLAQRGIKSTNGNSKSIANSIVLAQIHLKAGNVRLENRSPIPLTRLLVGKTKAEAMVILPMIFRICGMAHAGAVESVFDGAVSKNTNILIRVENIREHCLHILKDDKGNITPIKKPDLSYPELIGLIDKFKTCLKNDRIEKNKDEIFELVHILEQYVINIVCDSPTISWVEALNLRELLKWADGSNSICGQKIRHAVNQNEPSLGAIAFNPLWSENSARTVWENANSGRYETGALARVYQFSVIQELYQLYGIGHGVRVMARMIDCIVMLEELKKMVKANVVQMENENHDRTLEPIRFSQIETARGKLLHRAVIEHDRVLSYDVMAPTDVNFHSKGPCYTALTNMVSKLKPQGQDVSNMTVKIKSNAETIIHNFDPCIGYEIEVF